jgi:putative phosphoesterase
MTMQRLIISADIHGNYNSWLTVRSLMGTSDSLAVAGDLFDTRYGNFSNPDFDPTAIREDVKQMDHPFYYVYGNCDVASFFPGHDSRTTFRINGITIQMAHFPQMAPDSEAGLFIYGHTHLASIERKNGTIHLNPGTITSPRNGLFTYAVLNGRTLSLIDLRTGRPLHTKTI